MDVQKVLSYSKTSFNHGAPVNYNYYLKRVQKNQFKMIDKLKKLNVNQPFFGSILIGDYVDNFQYNAGFLKQQDSRLISNDSLYLTGSIQKFMTGIRIAQLEEACYLSRKNLVKNYFPELSNDQVTLEDLLLHRSGMKQYEPGDAKSYEQCIESILQDTFIESIYGQYEYNDGNYVLLSKVIEIVTGKSFKENIIQHILQPLHMYQTYFFDDVQGYFVHGMTNAYGLLCPTLDEPLVHYMGAGNMYMTLNDVQILCHAFVTGKILKQETMDRLIAPFEKYEQDYRYGFGVKKGYYRIRGVLNGIEVIAWFNDKKIVIVATNFIIMDDMKRSEKLVKYLFKNHKF
ncbi:serine hydrolase domain-containing protein [Macrococcus equi]|uniref:serine hydrolase domain-containing protein n=1 Tax=Macrococcus equi TaxID=3395462 RepID=UPI0039BE384B